MGDGASDGQLDPLWIGAFIHIEHWHFHRQLWERYGFVLAPGEFSRIKADMKSGRAPLVERRPNGGLIYSVRIKSARERIYILAQSGNIITAWPPERRLNGLRRRSAGERVR